MGVALFACICFPFGKPLANPNQTTPNYQFLKSKDQTFLFFLFTKKKGFFPIDFCLKNITSLTTDISH